MAGPPEGISPEELWARITAVPRAHRIVDFPRKDPATGEPICQLAIMSLNESENTLAVADATRRAHRLLKDANADKTEGANETYQKCARVELIWRFARNAGDLSKSFFLTKEHIGTLTPDETAILINQYVLIQRELSPLVYEMSPEEQEAWITRLAEGGSRSGYAPFTWGVLTMLVDGLASRLQALQQGNTSQSSQQSESSNEPPTDPELIDPEPEE